MSILDQDYHPYHFIEADEEYTCDRCRIASPLDGYDNCGRCQAIIEREELIEAAGATP
jgi:hypothetical protein